MIAGGPQEEAESVTRSQDEAEEVVETVVGMVAVEGEEGTGSSFYG